MSLSIVDQPSHRAIFIPEVLAAVFNILSAGQATKTARVCKAWLELSLDLIWKGPVGLEALVKLLAPTIRYVSPADGWVSQILLNPRSFTN